MRTKKLLQQTLELLGVTREELEHLSSCVECTVPLNAEGTDRCDAYARKFWGYERPEPRELTPGEISRRDFIQNLWAPEILRQAQASSAFRRTFHE